jgi:hypothetical protein
MWRFLFFVCVYVCLLTTCLSLSLSVCLSLLFIASLFTSCTVSLTTLIRTRNLSRQAAADPRLRSFLSTFAKLRKATISFVTSASPHETTRLPQDLFWWNFMFENFSKSVGKIQVRLTYDKNSGYFIWRSFHVCNSISLNSPWNEKCFGWSL